MTNNILFSHRPKLGVSLGAVSENGQLFIALALTNDGISRNNLFHKERRDMFSRVRACNIIAGRIKAMRKPSLFVTNNMVQASFGTNITAKDFIRELRIWFKPIYEETDATFNDIKIRDRIISMIWEKARQIVRTHDDINIEIQ